MLRALVLLFALLPLHALADSPSAGPVTETFYDFEDALINSEIVAPPTLALKDHDPRLEEADAFFLASDLSRAIALYKTVVVEAGPGANYARYKLAWCLLNIKDFEGAIGHLNALNQSLYREFPGGPHDSFIDTLLNDLITTAAYLDDVTRMKAVGAATCQPNPSPATCTREFEQRLSLLLLDKGREADARLLTPASP